MTRKLSLAGVILIVALLASATLGPQSPQPALAAPHQAGQQGGQLVSIPFELVTRHIVLKVRINNSRPLSFVFDTGDRDGVVDVELAKQLGLKLQGQVRVGGAGSDTLAGSLVEEANWTLDGLAGFSQPIRLAIPLGRLAGRFGHDFDGIIGSEFINQFVVEVDYRARVIRLHDKEKFAYTGEGESLPVQLNGHGYPIIDAEVTPAGGEPLRGKFVLDLGAGSALALYAPFVAQHRLLNSDLKTIRLVGAGGAGGLTTGRMGRVASLKIGRFTLANPFTVFSQDKAGAFASTEPQGNIGQQIAGRFRLFLDYGHNRIIFEPTPALNEPFDRAQTGLALTAEGRDYTIFRVTDVLENSPAAEAGLQKDDVIIQINDQRATELTITKLAEMFERPVAYKMTIRRGEQTLQVTLTPKKLI